MFVKKLVRKALKKPEKNSEGLKSEDIDPRLVFHYGIPYGAILLAYDSIQNIIAVSAGDGRIKLLGKDNTQTVLESIGGLGSKFLQFIENEGMLMNVTARNGIEAWDVDKRSILCVHLFHEEITSFTVLQGSFYMYVGDSIGNIAVLKLNKGACRIMQMNYKISLRASRGNTTGGRGNTAVIHMLPQPAAESKRLLVIYKDGFMILWGIQESKAIFTAGGNISSSLFHEPKEVTAACWACPLGSKVVVGYNNGEILVWKVPPVSNNQDSNKLSSSKNNIPAFKLNLGYKLNKIPIAFVKWAYSGGKESRLYVAGASESSSTSLLHAILLNEHTESRIVKMPLYLSEACLDVKVILNSSSPRKSRHISILIIGKSGHIYTYDDNLIAKSLQQNESRSTPLLPTEVRPMFPFTESSITAAKFITNNQCTSDDKDCLLLAKNVPPLVSFDFGIKGHHMDIMNLCGITKMKNLYITGHSNGSVNLWDVSCPIMCPVFSLEHQSANQHSSSGLAVTALCFDKQFPLLIYGNQNGMVCSYKFKTDPFDVTALLQERNKKGSNQPCCIKLLQENGAVTSLSIDQNSRNLVIGSDRGYVSLIDIEGSSILFQRHIPSELCTEIVFGQLENCNFHGFEKNTIVIATRDSSIVTLDGISGNTIGSTAIHPKRPCKALYTKILDGNGRELQLLLCSEKAAYVYSLNYIVQGCKKLHYKKKFSSLCYWASAFSLSSRTGLLLFYHSGKIEVRSLPDLSLLKESSIRGLCISSFKQEISICSSSDGELIAVNGDEEIFFISVFGQSGTYRILDALHKVYKHDLSVSEEDGVSALPEYKLKRHEGLFSSVAYDAVGKKKHAVNGNPESPRAGIEELTTIFSSANLSSRAVLNDCYNNESNIQIDDINLEDSKEKSKRHGMVVNSSKQKFASKLHNLKGKLKELTGKSEKRPENADEKPGLVDQIKTKYGFPANTESSTASIPRERTNENINKLQAIDVKTTDMHDKARTFSFMAKEVLRSTQKKPH